MTYTKRTLLEHINKIRKNIGHDEVNIDIKEIIFDKNLNELWIITDDRPDKSAIIGKGGWVVGRLREELGINSIHVESYSDFLIKKYRMELSFKKINSFIESSNSNKDYILPLNNLKKLIGIKLDNLYSFDFNRHFDDCSDIYPNIYPESSKHAAILALSGGSDSSFSLILAKKLGFNPIAVTVNPGTIVLPNQFKENIDKLVSSVEVEHHYIDVDYGNLIKDAFEGRFHPCGRCSAIIEENIYDYAINHGIEFVIFGDMLATGSQCITEQFHDNQRIFRLNLPAALSVSKMENQSLVKKYDLNKIKGFGCPLLYEVHKKFPYMKKFSIQRILRETRSGALEPGEALDLIWSFYKIK